MKEFLNFFVKNNGIWVGSAAAISKASAFFVVLFATNFLLKEDFGEVSSAVNFLGFFLALTGFGSYQGMLRFGATLKDEEYQKLRKYSFSYGLVLQFLLNSIMLILAAVFYSSNQSLLLIIFLFSIRFFGVFFLEQAKSEVRAAFNNKKYAVLDIVSALSLLFSAIILMYFFGKKGYIWALCYSPFVVFFVHRFRFSFQKDVFQSFSKKEFWNFSLTTAFGTQIGEWIYLLDIFFITLLLHQTDVAEYRVSNTIPVNLLFVAYIFLQTGYPELCKNYKNRSFHQNYLVNYYKFLVPVCLVILFAVLVFSKQLMLIFGKNYTDSSLLKILIFGSVSVILIRAPFTYVLAAIGKPKWNLWISIFMLVTLSAIFYNIIPVYGLEGVAYSSVFALTLSGILYGLAYFYELKKIKS